MNDINKNWFALYTKPRWEKKAHGILLLKKIESWCPLQKVERKWSDRKKIIEDPVFKSYVFVCINDDERLTVLQTDGILNFVHFGGKPAIIKEEELQLIKSFLLEKNTNISVAPLDEFEEKDKVIIRQGVFMDNTGTILKKGSRKYYVRLESLRQVMIVEFPSSYIEHYIH